MGVNHRVGGLEKYAPSNSNQRMVQHRIGGLEIENLGFNFFIQ